ncbi:hypothetical protein BACCIP111883_04091 [Sutcliffiella rhizosphaerae]|uniref:DUF3267 domain-containing protein n=1 Tax=Sutcliffiella rhizosphaerae TaxID=2880967 RepID=A0ABM8YTK2_9BACI|nr:hypothetical protein BACCIP111883_04091 [Sutcliffiella rhizosphaerae]
MILWFRNLPQKSMDLSVWTPFIQNNWCRKHYVKFVYLIQIIILSVPSFFFYSTGFTTINIIIIISLLVFIFHECLHLLILNKKDDISLTFSGIFFLDKYKFNTL